MSATLTLWTGFPTTSTPRRSGEAARFNGLKTAGMLIAAPFIGLAFIVGLPLGGLALLAATAARALMRSGRVLPTLKNIAMFFAAPFVGLAYLVVGPLVGIAMLATFAWRAATAPAA